MFKIALLYMQYITFITKKQERSQNHEKTKNAPEKRQKGIHANRKHDEKNQRRTTSSKRGNTIMTLNLYSLKDELNGFAPPIPFNNDEIAKRYFKEMCAENITIKHSPKDFSIWKVGEFNSETGTIESGTITSGTPTKIA